MCALAYHMLVRCLTIRQHENVALAEAIGSDRKGWLSAFLCLLGVGLAFMHAWLGFAMYAVVALIWFIPDSRIEKRLERE